MKKILLNRMSQIFSTKLEQKNKFGKKKFNNFFVLGWLRPPKPLACVKGGSGCFWIESPKSTGYRVSLLSVSESGSQSRRHSRLSPQFTRNFEYKINHISKTKNHKTIKICVKSVSERCTSSGIINFFFRRFQEFLTTIS